MSRQLTWRQELMNRFFAIPAVTQWWARRTAAKITEVDEAHSTPPFAPLRKPLSACKVAIITTAGVHLRSQAPFNMDDPNGDATYRELPAAVAAADMMITHRYYDHRDADQDLNVVFPLAHFRDLVEHGVIGSLAPRHFAFMGHIEGSQAAILTRKSTPDVGAKLRMDGVDFAFLTPA
ncbi:MAG: glycine/sarcosine/betaine reductase selenoprotein B family protein [Caldilineaceae bacterium]